MHLKERPTYFVKNGVRKPVYYSVDARQLIENGWEEEGKSKPKAKQPEPVIEEKVELLPYEPAKEEIQETSLDEMTKAELVEYAEENEIEIDPYSLKSVILEACKAGSNG
jgi:hypothetical protein